MFNMDGVSVIVPFYNEHETLQKFCEVMDDYASGLDFKVELVFLNDGSTDDSVEIVKNFEFKNVYYAKLVQMSRNFGFHAAVRAGIKETTFDICTWFGADLQEPLEILPIAFEKISKNQFDIVYFSKNTIKVSFFNRLFSKIYSALMKKYAISTYSSDGTATVAFNGKIKNILNENIESNSQVILQIMNMGIRYDSVSLDYNARSAGKSKWNLSMKIKAFIDSFVAFSYMPIRLVSICGIFIFLIGILLGGMTIINRFVNPDVQIGYSTIVSTLALGFGVTNISLGIIAEYLWRTLDASRRRPVYLVSEVVQLFNKDTNN